MATTPPNRLLCWTVCAYRKPGLDEAEYHKHMSEVHGPLVKELMVKYDFVKWSMVCFTVRDEERGDITYLHTHTHKHNLPHSSPPIISYIFPRSLSPLAFFSLTKKRDQTRSPPPQKLKLALKQKTNAVSPFSQNNRPTTPPKHEA